MQQLTGEARVDAEPFATERDRIAVDVVLHRHGRCARRQRHPPDEVTTVVDAPVRVSEVAVGRDRDLERRARRCVGRNLGVVRRVDGVRCEHDPDLLGHDLDSVARDRIHRVTVVPGAADPHRLPVDVGVVADVHRRVAVDVEGDVDNRPRADPELHTHGTDIWSEVDLERTGRRARAEAEAGTTTIRTRRCVGELLDVGDSAIDELGVAGAVDQSTSDAPPLGVVLDEQRHIAAAETDVRTERH